MGNLTSRSVLVAVNDWLNAWWPTPRETVGGSEVPDLTQSEDVVTLNQRLIDKIIAKDIHGVIEALDDGADPRFDDSLPFRITDSGAILLILAQSSGHRA
jgi:hypothetical protein